ncbi:MAG: DNA/RNA helicase domain-containing protein [Anaerolineaceae bacterium]|nr:DNA/RNA helicase domain-containing protein [Anaerolineaceae bacterium]
MEFKVGSKEYTKHAIDQVTDYALDLQNFHKESHNRLLIPILIATKAPNIVFSCKEMKANILEVTKCNQDNLKKSIESLISKQTINTLNAIDWINSPYSPTPTIIEAAQELYRGHSVIDISRSDATAKNLNQTTKAINKIIDDSKLKRRKSICFITGVPGAGKTLAGLNIANERHKFDENEHAIFLSGNKPLVDVLQEALARDECSRTGRKNLKQ